MEKPKIVQPKKAVDAGFNFRSHKMLKAKAAQGPQLNPIIVAFSLKASNTT